MFRAIDKWLPGTLRHAWRVRGLLARAARPLHLIFCVADHFEPFRGGASKTRALDLVRRWVDEYPDSAAEFKDADGCGPRHTFFYPHEEYDKDCLDQLTRLCAAGHGEIEIHLHHRNDTPAGFREKLVGFRDRLRREHGLLGTDRDGVVRYGFVHGNWSLCNSRPDGDWCGVNEELGILRETGCYADFTYPSAPSPTQPRMVNALYYAKDAPGRPRGPDRGVRCGVVGVRDGEEPGDLLLIQGPLALNWRSRKWGVLPRLENAEISGGNPPSAERLGLWTAQHIHVHGRPDWVFVKLHTHGCVEGNRRVLLGAPMRRLHRILATQYNDTQHWHLHYVTAREMYNIVRAAEAGTSNDPGAYRDFEIGHPDGAR